MAVADLCLFVLLSAFTLSTLDGGEVASDLLSAATLLLGSIYFAFRAKHLSIPIPVTCLLLMSLYGVIQTLWFPHKIVSNGWSGVVFWLTAAVISLLSFERSRDHEMARRFRRWFVCLGVFVSLLDLLEQATQTNSFYWLIPSKFATVNGPFAYWNNFAQFIELVLPITLWLGLRNRKPSWLYLLFSGLEIAAVIASGSRAGSVLVIMELLTVSGLLYLRHRHRGLLYAAGAALALSLLFVAAAGTEKLGSKLRQKDQLAARRDINLSSLAMIRQHPLTGWGLNTYVPVYRMFARYDDGTYVNRAHNDWLQWTAEGGIFFAALMLIVFIWSIRPAVHSVWGIGVIAICLHAIVDYPFARFGVCGWYFSLIGMLAARSSVRRRVIA